MARINEVSSLSDAEYIQLIGHYQHMVRGSKEEIDPGLADRGYSPEALAALQKRVKVAGHSVTSLGIRFKQHLSKYNYPLMPYVLTLFENYERGNLPYPGCLADQPAKIIEIFNLLTNLKLEQEQRQLREQQKAHNGRF